MDTHREFRARICTAAPGLLLVALLASPALLTIDVDHARVRQAFRLVTSVVCIAEPGRTPAPSVTTGTRG